MATYSHPFLPEVGKEGLRTVVISTVQGHRLTIRLRPNHLTTTLLKAYILHFFSHSILCPTLDKKIYKAYQKEQNKKKTTKHAKKLKKDKGRELRGINYNVKNK